MISGLTMVAFVVIAKLSSGAAAGSNSRRKWRQWGNSSGSPPPDTTSAAYKAANPQVVVMVPSTTNSTYGAASVAPLSAAAGLYGDATGANYTVGMRYNNGGTNAQGQIQLILQRGSHGVYYVKSNSISSLAFSNQNTLDGNLPKDATIYTKASIYKINNGAVTSVDGNVTLRVDAHEGCTATTTNAASCLTGTGDKIGFTVLSTKNSALYYSNNWQYDAATKSWRTLLEDVTGVAPNTGCAFVIN